MAFQETNNLVDTIVNTQKKVMDSVVENTKKFTNGNNVLNETIEKGSDWFKNWIDGQKTMFTKATDLAKNVTETPTNTAENTAKANEFLQNWMNMQTTFAKQMWDMSMEAAKNMSNGTTANAFTANNPFTNTANPFAQWQNAFGTAQNQWSNYMNNMNAANWMNNMQSMNPFNNDTFKKASNDATNIFNQYYNMLNSTFTEWQKSFQNGTVQDAYKSMINTGMGFTKFAEMWAPMFKSMQDKTFNMDLYRQYLNPALYKEFIDKYFSFMPESSREYMNNMTNMMNDSMKNMSANGMEQYRNMRNMMNQATGNFDMFGNMYNAYNQFTSMMTEAAAPFNKLVTPNAQTKAMTAWSNIMDRIAQYNMKNVELQMMMYNQGAKVMDALAENTAKKMQEGTEVKSMLALYQEWLNISDKTYVSLFESEEYSKLMAEVSSLQNKLRMDIEAQMEKMMENIPVATRSEMDEVYKSLYDLRKQVRQLEKMLDLDGEQKIAEAPAAEPKAAPATKGAKKA